MSGERVYLFVPVEESTLAQLLGACWDAGVRCWYVDVELARRFRVFGRWMPYTEGDELNVISDVACIASLKVPCQLCGQETEVICIRCEGGMVEGRPLRRFTCTRIFALDDRLSALIQACYSQLRPAEGQTPEHYVSYVNHCLHCGAPHEERYLDAQWDAQLDAQCELHFNGGTDLQRGEKIELIPIAGTVRLRGRARLLRE